MKEIEEIRDKMPGSTGVISDLGNATATCISSSARAHKVERSRSKGLKPALTRYSAITHQRSNGAGNKAARSEAGAVNAPTASRNGGKAGNGKPVGSQLQKGAGNGKPSSQGTGQGAGQSAGKSKPAGKPAHKGKTPTRAGSAKPGAKPATQGGKPAAKGNGAKRPAR